MVSLPLRDYCEKCDKQDYKMNYRNHYGNDKRTMDCKAIFIEAEFIK